jgi:hypothetical protein
MDAGVKTASSKKESPARRRAQEYYECCFCKRGFTNAQALGGHMNIHRKERSDGAAPPAAGAQHEDVGGASGSRPEGADQVQLDLTLGRSEVVDLELRLWH